MRGLIIFLQGMLLFDMFEVELLLIRIIKFCGNNFIYSMYYVCVQYKVSLSNKCC